MWLFAVWIDRNVNICCLLPFFQALVQNFICPFLLSSSELYFNFHRFIGNLDLCGQQVHKPCRTSLGFPAVLPHAASDEAAGKFSVPFKQTFLITAGGHFCNHFDSNSNLLSTGVGISYTNPVSYPVDIVVPTKRSSHYIKGLLIGVMSTMAFALFILLGFLWARLLSKKERVAKKYTEVTKQVNQEAGTLNAFWTLTI